MTGATTDTVGGLLCAAGQRLRAAGIEAPRLEARLLLGHALGCTTDALLRDPHACVVPDRARLFASLVARRVEAVPVAYLLGEREFWSLPFAVSLATLIPRPDTETLIEAALVAQPDRGAVRRILDLGTGTGCLLLAALTEFPAAHGVGLDRVEAAAVLARGNARRLGLAARASFAVADWAGPVGGRFDLVLCNPPYVASAELAGLMPEVARHEPASALDGGVDGLDAYGAVLGGLRATLATGAVAVIELGFGQRDAVGAMARAAGLEVAGCHPDLSGVPRALVLRAAPAQKTFGQAGAAG